MEIAGLVITSLGIGSLLTVFLQSRLDRRKQIAEKEHEFKLVRYKCIILLMYAKLTWDNDNGVSLRINRPDIKDIRSLDNELKTELANCLLFANKEVIEALTSYVGRSDFESFVKAVSAMRKDLWGVALKIPDIFQMKKK
jgi:hypothetical protein